MKSNDLTFYLIKFFRAARSAFRAARSAFRAARLALRSACFFPTLIKYQLYKMNDTI